MSTKENILEAAFRFYKKPNFVDFSMAELAANVGISKPAIYRHFSSKEDLTNSMRERFADTIAEFILKIYRNEEKGASEQFADLIAFLAGHTEYINYFISNLFYDDSFGGAVNAMLVERGVRESEILLNIDVQSGDGLQGFSRTFYCGTLLLSLVMLRDRILCEAGRPNAEGIGEFARRAVEFITGGFASCAGGRSVLFPSDIGGERRRQLESLCSIAPGQFGEEDRFFVAFASALRKYGLRAVTLERIADELGMAKSSLYFYFDNKNRMILGLIEKELNLLSTIVRENSAEARNASEFFYILMFTELSYFNIRPSMIPIFGWLLQDGIDSDSFCDGATEIGEMGSAWEGRMERSAAEFSLGFPLRAQHLTKCMGMIPVALIGICEKKGIGYGRQKEILRLAFDFVQFGVDGK